MLTFDRVFMESLRQWKTISWFVVWFFKIFLMSVIFTICQFCDIFGSSYTCQEIPNTKSGMQTVGMEGIK